ncbi:MAG TPA: hypothetical protein VNQ80_12205 [Parapedobacter sp.]|uniref:hypothetical protein n=1 Tax=Parapedobacter sp. TaxID=1958893 RepID=UPI002B78C240|nr:hypothetical protein [Parapedobacter sp.]HWK58099.1 hypothetical protein [Parapedobacter sp.]
MKEFVLQNLDKFKKYPIPFIALVFIGMYIHEASENREDYRNCQSELKRKDVELSAAHEQVRQTNEQLLDYAFQIRMYREGRGESDSTIKKETQSNVKKILKQ